METLNSALFVPHISTIYRLSQDCQIEPICDLFLVLVASTAKVK